MITEDSLAAATIAQIFGSELLRAQQNARTDGGSQPEIVKMHPTQFIQHTNPNQAPSVSRAQQDKRMLEMLQREAEMSCPLPEPTYRPAPPPPQPVTTQQAALTNVEATGLPVLTGGFENVNKTLERIAVSLEKLIEIYNSKHEV